MATTNYYTVNGRIIGERTTGGSRTDYVRDGLGSVVATTDSTGSVVNTYRYKPYGEQLSMSGVGADPMFQWVGQWGYGNGVQNIYVRNRHYNERIATWIAVDVFWPSESNYGYAHNSPVTKIDEDGQYPVVDPSCKGCLGAGSIGPVDWSIWRLNGFIKKFCDAINDSTKSRCIESCLSIIRGDIQCLRRWCQIGKGITCNQSPTGLCGSYVDNYYCLCSGKVIKVPHVCGYTTSGVSMSRKMITLCCSQFQPSLTKLCDCPPCSLEPHYNTDSCDVLETVWHEIGHLCAPTPPGGDLGHQELYRRYVECIKKCIS